MTAAETALFDSTEPTAEMVRAACLAVDALPNGERYRRVGRIGQYCRAFAPSFSKAVAGFQSFGTDAVTFQAL